MPVLKRLRDWFFQVTATSTTKGTRFLKYDQPTEETYRNLFTSVPFFLETDDRAKETEQGLVHKATDAEAKGYDETETTTKTKTVVPSQLPEVKSVVDNIPLIDKTSVDIPAFSGEIVSVSIASNATEDANFNKRNVFLLRLTGSFLNWLRNALSSIIDAIDNASIMIPGGTTGQYLRKNSNADGDYSWADVVIPGGTTGQYLRKNSSTDGDYSWTSKVHYQTFVCISNPETHYILLPFNGTVSIASISNANSPTLPAIITANTLVTFSVTKVNPANVAVITLSITEI